jgi:L-lactate dehydrogenase complex protein LldG
LSTDRDSFLHRVRQAVIDGNRAGIVPPLPERCSVGYQGAGPDPVARLRDEVVAAGGRAHLVPDADSAVATIVELVRSCAARRVLLGGGDFIDTLPLAPAMAVLGVEVCLVSTLTDPDARPVFFAADVGITGVDDLVAETGSIVQETRPDQPRAVSLLPPVHIAVAHARQIVPDLFDLFTRPRSDGMPACLSLITGPSKTGDIELKLVTGVHGPGQVHVVVVTDADAGHRS